MTPEAGLAITPSVRLLRPLGRGGMGSVWLAEHETLRMSVVVKFMATALAEDRQATARFVQEATVAAQVRSPHVVAMLDHGMYDGVPYIVMEHLAGEDLAARLRRGPLSPGAVLAIVEQLALALGRVHERGIIHRDIKPANVFLCSDTGRALFVKLLDFGVAKASDFRLGDASTQTGALVGTPVYMSPEHLAGSKTLDFRSDLWAVGILVFEALTGSRPFRADSIGELVLLVHGSAPPRITDRAPGLPPAVDAWFARACARPPEDRFDSAEALAHALAHALRGVDDRGTWPGPVLPTAGIASTSAIVPEPTSAPTGGATVLDTPLVPSRVRSRRRTAALVGVVALAAAVPGALYAARSRRLVEPAAVTLPAARSTTPSVLARSLPSDAGPVLGPNDRPHAEPTPPTVGAVSAIARGPKRKPKPSPAASTSSGPKPFEDIE